MRFDAARSHADDADKTPDATGTNASLYNVSPQALWNSYYGGERKNAPVDLTASGRLLYRHDIQDGALKIDIHRDVRIPEAGERFYGSSGPASVVQVGDPELKPEAHHRVDLGAEQGYNGWSGFLTEQATPGSFRLAAGASADRVINFITADRAHGQGGILLNNNAIIYRNVDATVLGATLDGGWQIAPHLGLSGHLDWTHGQNTTDSRALYQIPPLEGKVILEHRESLAEDLAGSLGMRLNFAATQHRVDAYNSTGSGEDTGGQTPGYAVWDLFAGVTVYNHIAISAGIANIFNKEYHPHINPLPDGPTTQPLEAPGRAAFVMASVGF